MKTLLTNSILSGAQTWVAMLFCIFTLSACGTHPERTKKPTLADIDISDSKSMQANVFVKPKSRAEIKQAYYNYIKNASSSDKSRLTAVNRIATMELELGNKLAAESEGAFQESSDDDVYDTTLKNTAELLSSSIREFPDARDVDKSLYQLARTYSELGETKKVTPVLQNLVSNHPKSVYYAEAQFRLAESAFATGDYITSEEAYTETILARNNQDYYEKAIFKRGWTRYKQEIYKEAIDDFILALTYHDFGPVSSLNTTEKNQFDEYFRAIGLAFSYIPGAESLNEYFAGYEDFRYLFHTYTVVSNIYLAQERFSDAAQTFKQYINHFPNADNRPVAHLNAIKIWKTGNFVRRFNEEIELFYTLYHPGAAYWKNNADDESLKTVQNALREYVVLMSRYYHDLSQNKNPKKQNLDQAEQWYKRYLQHFKAYARQENIYSLYAELLAQSGRNTEALELFELAAYDGDLILDKKSAYATITLSDQFVTGSRNEARKKWLDRHIQFVVRYARLYPNDTVTPDLVIHAARQAFTNKNYSAAIDVATLLQNVPQKYSFDLGNIKARAYLETQAFEDAELAFLDLSESPSLQKSRKKQIDNSAALAIYRQAEMANQAEDTTQAIAHFARISARLPNSDLAPTGLFDAISLAIKNTQWNEAIQLSQRFQQRYPRHKRVNDVNRQLSVAYLESNQSQKAAQQFENIAKSETDDKVKMAALWKAAELYESKKDYQGSIRSYREYAHTYPAPYPQAMEAMYKLATLYQTTREPLKRAFWQQKIQKADAKTSKRHKNDRTNFIAATAILDLAVQRQNTFRRIKLVEPLAANLKKKKTNMQNAITLFGQASAYSLKEVTTQATYSIGEIYQQFSQALLDSERPKHLSGDELEQYNILLEDQAFPFEEKAIEFYETNLSRVKDGTYNQWIDNSFKQLRILFPVRFERKGKVEAIGGIKAISDVKAISGIKAISEEKAISELKASREIKIGFISNAGRKQ